MALAFEGGLAALACVVGWFTPRPPWARVAWRWEDIGWGLAATVPMLLILFGMRRVNRGPIGQLNQVVDSLVAPLFSRCSVLQLLVISVIAGIGEEFLFRGVVQPLLIAVLTAVGGILMTSVIFGLLHAVTWMYAVLATGVSIYLGWLALATDNLLGPIIAHSLYDFLALVYLTRFVSIGLAIGAAAKQPGDEMHDSIGDGTHDDPSP